MRISDWSSDVCSSDLWLLIRLKPRGKETRENWLLRKIGDAEAGGTDTLVETCLTSVKTGRTMQEIAEGKKAHVLPRKRESRAKNGARGTLDSRGRGNTRIPEFRDLQRSEEHTSELQSLMRISYAVFCLK